MKFNLYRLFLLLLPVSMCAQTILPEGHIGNFGSASSISINPNGILYISDSAENEIYQMDTLGNTIKTIGGFGWDSSQFDSPVDVYSSVLNVYVADKNNNRIQMFDKDLNYTSQFSSKNTSSEEQKFSYPTGVSQSAQGDLYILDSDNRRILKFNLQGEFQTSIGGLDAGRFQLTNPTALALADNSNLLAISDDELIVYDSFGNGLRKNKLPFIAENICVNSNFILVVGDNNLAIYSFTPANELERVANFDKLGIDERVIDAALHKNKVYLLTKTAIHVFKIIIR